MNKLNKPVNLYRLQLNYLFPFSKVEKWLEYFSLLGIDTLYLSSLFQANVQSLHGYDVTNPLKINKELGGIKGFKKLANKAKHYNITLVIDLVANHMSTSLANSWWYDVLESGKNSPFSSYFDIHWNSSDKRLKNKVLLPLLDISLDEALKKKKLSLISNKKGLFISVDQMKLPLSLTTYHDVLAKIKNSKAESFLKRIKSVNTIKDQKKRAFYLNDVKSCWSALFQCKALKKEISIQCEKINRENGPKGSLTNLLSRQNYLIESWKNAFALVNYRRFFDIHSLVALKMEKDHVFNHYHSLIFDLLKHNDIQGLRIDHPDGLYDPCRYFKNLQENYAGLFPQKTKEEKPLYLIIEKILQKDEKIPQNWPVEGSVGYEYLNLITHLYIDKRSKKLFQQFYEDFIRDHTDYLQLLLEEKRVVCRDYLKSDIEFLSLKLKKIFKIFSFNAIQKALVELFSSFPVYRTYLEENTVEMSQQDESVLNEAFQACLKNSPQSQTVLKKIQHIFFKKTKKTKEEAEFIMRFQQLCPAVMAKGFEDTHLYNFNQFLAFNEVGGFPEEFGVSRELFHSKMQDKLKNYPYSWIPSSTHDAKRSEGVRLRLVALSEVFEEWKGLISMWTMRYNKDKASLIDKNMEYFIYQSIVGLWPCFDLDKEEKINYIERIKNYIIKSAKEAKRYTNWINQSVSYEKALMRFLDKIFLDVRFYEELTLFVKKIAVYGYHNVLSATVLKIGLPAALDVYQGTEFVDFALVDPDNRRNVNFEIREEILKKLYQSTIDQSLCKTYDHIKMHIMHVGLMLRKKNPDLIFCGEYLPLFIEGEAADHVIAYARIYRHQMMIVITTRFFSQLCLERRANTVIDIPSRLRSDKYTEIFTSEKFNVTGKIFLKELCSKKNFAILVCRCGAS